MTTVTLGRGGKYGRIEVDESRLNDEVKAYVWDYGLRQVLNDAMATKTIIVKDDGGTVERNLTDEEIVAKATKRLENLYAGVLRSRSEGEPADPFEAECYREAKRTVEASLRTKGLFKDVPKGTKDRLMFVVNRARAAAGKPEATEAAYLAEVLEGPAGADIKKRARAAIKAREIDLDRII